MNLADMYCNIGDIYILILDIAEENPFKNISKLQRKNYINIIYQ